MTSGPTTGGVAWRPVRRHLGAVRRSHSTRSAAGVASLVYEWLLYLFIAGGVVVTSLSSTIASFAPPPALGWWLAAAAVPAGAAAVASVLLAVGPLVVMPGYATWLLPSPVDRRGLLATRAGVTVVATGVLGAGATGLVVSAVDLPAWGPALACGGFAGVLLAALCVLAQSGGPQPERAAGVAVRCVLVASLLAVVAAVLAARTGVDVAVPSTGRRTDGVWIAAVVGAVLAAVVGATAWRRLDRAGTPSLTRGAALVSGLWAASVALDPELTTGVVQERRLRRHGVVRSRRHRPGRRRALLAAHRHAALRNGSAWAWTAGLLVVPYVAALLVSAVFVPAVQMACATAVAARFSPSLRAVTGSAALRRSLGGRDVELTALHCVVPLLVTVGWTVLAAASGGSAVSLVLLPLSALAVVVRTATRPPRAATVTLYETPVGISIPVELARDLSRGPVLFVVLAGVQMLAG